MNFQQQNEYNNEMIIELRKTINNPDSVKNIELATKLVRIIQYLCLQEVQVLYNSIKTNFEFEGYADCPYCMKMIGDTTHIIKMPYCSHIYHMTCAKQQLKDNIKYCISNQCKSVQGWDKLFIDQIDKSNQMDKSNQNDQPKQSNKQSISQIQLPITKFQSPKQSAQQSLLYKPTHRVSYNSIFTCPRCIQIKIRDEDAITLECNHVVCKQCLKVQLTNCERQRLFKSKDITCKQCQIEIAYPIIQANAPKSYTKFIEESRSQEYLDQLSLQGNTIQQSPYNPNQ